MAGQRICCWQDRPLGKSVLVRLSVRSSVCLSAVISHRPAAASLASSSVMERTSDRSVCVIKSAVFSVRYEHI